MSASQPPAAIVTIVVDGEIVPSLPPARIAGGKVVVPPALVARIADRVTVFPTGSVTAERAGKACAAAAPIALAPLARCLGAAVAWDAHGRTLALAFPPRITPLRTPVPVPAVPLLPTPAPTAAPAATPRPVMTGIPRPRRTAIPVEPSEPVTAPRPSAL